MHNLTGVTHKLYELCTHTLRLVYSRQDNIYHGRRPASMYQLRRITTIQRVLRSTDYCRMTFFCISTPRESSRLLRRLPASPYGLEPAPSCEPVRHPSGYPGAGLMQVPAVPHRASTSATWRAEAVPEFGVALRSMDAEGRTPTFPCAARLPLGTHAGMHTLGWASVPMTPRPQAVVEQSHPARGSLVRRDVSCHIGSGCDGAP